MRMLAWLLTLLSLVPLFFVTFTFLQLARNVRVEEMVDARGNPPAFTQAQLERTVYRRPMSFRFSIAGLRFSTPVRVHPFVLALGWFGAACLLAFTVYTFRGVF